MKMKNYDNPKMFRDEADSLERFVLSHQFLKPYLDSYNIHMAKYFLSGEYECRKKALYFKKKNAKKAATERSRDGLKIRFEIVKSLKKPIK